VRLLPVPVDLSRQRRDVTPRLGGIVAITFDFGNTLVPVGRDALRRVVELTADGVTRADPTIDRTAFLEAWAEERERQFRENVPQFREVDLAERLVRVFARLRGMAPPPPDGAWDQEGAAAFSAPDEIARAIDVYSRAFVDGLPPVAGVDELLAGLAAEGRRLAILSNWPLAATIDRYAEARGWTPALTAVVVSQRVGVIKPHAAIFAAARAALGDPAPGAMLHVGDDWAADIVGAAAAGWRAAWVRARPADSPLPSSEPSGDVRADLELATVIELASRLAPLGTELVTG
jgi:FMN phosphatase YigB (HAD superfamily)